MSVVGTSTIRVMFSTPTLDHRICLEFFKSYFQTAAVLNEAGIEVGQTYVGGDQFIAKARNLLVKRFLDSPATDLFFLDDDIGWEPEAALRLLLRPEPVVCGAYPQKSAAVHYPVTLDGGTDGVMIERDGLYKALLAPTGFMRIKRHVVQKLWDESAEYTHRFEDDSTEMHRAVFEAGVHHDSKEFWGEDYYFCRRCADFGFGVWVDPEITFTHRGNKVWKGRFADEIKARRESLRMKEAA